MQLLSEQLIHSNAYVSRTTKTAVSLCLRSRDCFNAITK